MQNTRQRRSTTSWRRRASALALLAASLALPLPAQAADVSVDRSTKYQTIDGFGFFGAMDDWWSPPGAGLVTDAWATQVIDDLGLTIWRNEYYPPADSISGQDADWAKQKPVVTTLKRVADAHNVPLKFIFTVWSPPSSMKCNVSNTDYMPIEGSPWPQGTKGGGGLCRSSWDAFASWLVQGVQQYKDAGIDLYALSFQNEPMFWEAYNSTFYKQPYYAEVLAYVGPKIKAAFPNVKIFGSENMLEMEGGSDSNYFYTGEIKANAAAASALDIVAVHGYSDGVVPTSGSKMASLWGKMLSDFVTPMNKPLWMTETSGYVEAWSGSPGARELGQTIWAALNYGHLSGWVWWQGSEAQGITQYNLMQGTTALGKRYHVSKNFYRYIRPGARMVKTSTDDPSVLAAAFDHASMGAFTSVLINTSDTAKTVNLVGSGLPSTFRAYRTSASEDTADVGSVGATAITLPASSLTTLVNGNVYETAADNPPPAAGSGGSSGAGGASPGSGGSSGTAGASAASGGSSGTAGAAAASGGSSGSAGRPSAGGGGSSGTAGAAALAPAPSSSFPGESSAGTTDVGMTGGCSLSSGAPRSTPSTLAGLMVAAAAFLASRRRRSERPGSASQPNGRTA